MEDLTRTQLRELWRHTSEGDGGHCPVCDRWGKVYSVTLTGSMVRALGWLYREHLITGDKWINLPKRMPRHVMRSYSITSLKHWGFIEQQPKPKPPPKPEGVVVQRKRGEKKEPVPRTSGNWGITEHGRIFITNQIAVPKKVYLYDDIPRGFDSETAFAKELMDEVFDYDAMMHDLYNQNYKDEDETDND